METIRSHIIIDGLGANVVKSVENAVNAVNNDLVPNFFVQHSINFNLNSQDVENYDLTLYLYRGRASHSARPMRDRSRMISLDIPMYSPGNEDAIQKFIKLHLERGLAEFILASGKSLPEYPELDWVALGNFGANQADGILRAYAGLIDLAPTRARDELIKTKIEMAVVAIKDLITACRQGNLQHLDLAIFGERYLNALEKLGNGEPGIIWYLFAHQIEVYRSNYVASSNRNPAEYPYLEPALSALIDTVVLANGILCQEFPEITKCQEDFEKYSGREMSTRHEVRALLDASLSDLASAKGIFTDRASLVAQNLADLKPPSSLDHVSDKEKAMTWRILATKSGFVRGFLGVITRAALVVVHSQSRNFFESVKKLGLYDLSKEITKELYDQGFGNALTLIGIIKPILRRLGDVWPAMFNFVAPLLRVLGLI